MNNKKKIPGFVDWVHIKSIFRNWYHQKMMFFQIIWLLNFLSSLIKKQPFIIFLLIKQRIYDYFSEFASEAPHIVFFENFVKSMTTCYSYLSNKRACTLNYFGLFFHPARTYCMPARLTIFQFFFHPPHLIHSDLNRYEFLYPIYVKIINFFSNLIILSLYGSRYLY